VKLNELNWRLVDEPELKRVPAGTLIAYKQSNGKVYLAEMGANLPDDERIKLKRLDDGVLKVAQMHSHVAVLK